MLFAPRLDWSPRRAKYVFASTLVGAFLGCMIAGLATNSKSTDANGNVTNGHYNDDVITDAMAAGLWVGFGLSIAMTHDSEPDTRYIKPVANARPGSPMMLAPWIGKDSTEHSTFGLATGGSW